MSIILVRKELHVHCFGVMARPSSEMYIKIPLVMGKIRTHVNIYVPFRQLHLYSDCTISYISLLFTLNE